MTQTKTQALAESVVNTAVSGAVYAATATLTLLFVSDSGEVVLVALTLSSIAKNYAIRRLFV